MEIQFQVGDIVRAEYKSGEYIGEVVEVMRTKAAVKVLAVTRHPAQGDLHHPGEVDGVVFLQRKALAHREIASVPFFAIRPLQLEAQEIPEYRASLLQSLQSEIDRLGKMTSSWAQKSLEHLEQLKDDYRF